MNRRLSALVAIAAAALLLAGCGSSGDTGSVPTSQTTAGTTPTQWVESLCTALGTVDRSQSTAPAPNPSGDEPPSGKALMTTLFKALELRFDQGLTKVTELGAPPVADGQRLFDDSLREMRAARDTVAELNAELAKLQDLDEAAFMAASQPFTTAVEEAEGANPIAPLAQNPELKAALESLPSCKDVYDPSES